jgi:hypothetical protein
MGAVKLWHVEIHEDDWDYDNFVAAVVWADSAEEAERIVRAERRYPDRPDWDFAIERPRPQREWGGTFELVPLVHGWWGETAPPV